MHLHGQPWASQYKKASTGMVSVPVDGWFSGFIKLGLPHYLVGGWVWNMNFMTFYILGIITDFHIFQRGRLKPPSTLPRIFSRKDLFHIGLSRRSRSFLSASRSAPDLQVCAGAVTFFRVKDSSFPIVKPSFSWKWSGTNLPNVGWSEHLALAWKSILHSWKKWLGIDGRIRTQPKLLIENDWGILRENWWFLPFHLRKILGREMISVQLPRRFLSRAAQHVMGSVPGWFQGLGTRV